MRRTWRRIRFYGILGSLDVLVHLLGRSNSGRGKQICDAWDKKFQGDLR